MSDLFELLGPLAWPLAICSVVALGLIIERVLFFARYAWPFDLVGENQPIFKEAIQLLEANGSSPVASADQSREAEQAVELHLESWRMRLMERLGVLGLIATVAPLLGLLGTVLGMIVAFQDIASHSGPLEPALIADGLWNAMATTAAGLSIAVPALLAGHGFRLWSQALVEQIAFRLNRLSVATITDIQAKDLRAVAS